MTEESHFESTSFELPENYEELKKAAHRTSDWQERLNAVNELGQYNHQPIIDLLTHMMNNDPVYAVQDAAYKQLRGLGQDVQQPSKAKPELFKGLTKTLIRIKKSLPKDHSFEDFKVKLQKMRADIYNTYEGEKGEEFDNWLKAKWESYDTK